jgi:DNA-directed RNA polymerase specialized sigma24 family protein
MVEISFFSSFFLTMTRHAERGADAVRRARRPSEIEAELREIGLPVELVEHLRKVPEELDWDEDPDPYGMMKDVTPPAGDTVDAVAVDSTSANNGDKAEESLDDALSKLSPEERAIVEARAEELRKQAEAQSKDPIE